jgi:hypothetical protein
MKKSLSENHTNNRERLTSADNRSASDSAVIACEPLCVFIGRIKKMGIYNARVNDGNSVIIHKAYYLCSCTKEFLTPDVDKLCPVCKARKTRIVTFQANRLIEGNRILYPECGIIF